MSLDALNNVFDAHGRLALAVSGGVDSMTLAHAAHHHRPDSIEIFHAVSAAVPVSATERVQRHAAAAGWALRIIDAGEMNDPAYIANPVDRCFHCKSNLYGAIGSHTDATITSGTNLDDLDDYRPGLRAAADAAVIHPFVEAGLDKAEVRALATELGLDDLAELPAAPCLSSRVETGIAIDGAWLRAIDDIEARLRADVGGDTVRCRLRADHVVLELDRDVVAGLTAEERARITAMTAARFGAEGVDRPVRIEPYRRGSAFLTVEIM